MNHTIENDYYHWITSLASEWCYDYGSFQKLFDYLYSREFYSVIKKDDNRAADGIDFRTRFIDGHPYYTYRDCYLYLTKPCNILELMCALAFRCDEDIMYDPDQGNRSGYWFYEMLKSMHLDGMSDDCYDADIVERIVNNFLERKYKRNGEGGLFTIRNTNQDVRKVEIWFQLLWHLNEVLES